MLLAFPPYCSGKSFMSDSLGLPATVIAAPAARRVIHSAWLTPGQQCLTFLYVRPWPWGNIGWFIKVRKMHRGENHSKRTFYFPVASQIKENFLIQEIWALISKLFGWLPNSPTGGWVRVGLGVGVRTTLLLPHSVLCYVARWRSEVECGLTIQSEYPIAESLDILGWGWLSRPVSFNISCATPRNLEKYKFWLRLGKWLRLDIYNKFVDDTCLSLFRLL